MSEKALPQTVGVFGLGLIGYSLAQRLMAAGIEVYGHDPAPDCMEKLRNAGGQPVVAEEVWTCDVLLSAVFDTAQLASLIARAPKDTGKCLISMSTCDPAEMPQIALKAAAKGIELLEAPISGTSADLANGNAVLLIAGEEQTALELAPLFCSLSRAHYFVGTMGNGNRAKLAINLILGLGRAALAEGLVFAKAIGLNPETFFEVARDSAAASKVMESKGPKMVAGDFAPLGRIAQSVKDFDLIRETARQAGQGLPMTERYIEIVADNIEHGEGGLDNSAVMLAVERARMPWNAKG